MLYTIGYASKSIEEFLECLKLYNINCIVDIRTVPYSKQFPEYDANKINSILKKHNIYYVPFGQHFGARRSELEAYEKVKDYNGNLKEIVIFKNVYNLSTFQKGYERIKIGLKKNLKICFMCSEKNPFACHRSIMVSQFFYMNKFEIQHIIDKNENYSHNVIIEELKLNFYKMKKEFKEKNINIFMYGNSLLSQYDGDIENINIWSSFFENYTEEKGVYLRNLQIGYVKGDEDYE